MRNKIKLRSKMKRELGVQDAAQPVVYAMKTLHVMTVADNFDDLEKLIEFIKKCV